MNALQFIRRGIWHYKLSYLGVGDLALKWVVKPACEGAFKGIQDFVNFMFTDIGTYVFDNMQKNFDETVNNVDMCPPDTS